MLSTSLAKIAGRKVTVQREGQVFLTLNSIPAIFLSLQNTHTCAQNSANIRIFAVG